MSPGPDKRDAWRGAAAIALRLSLAAAFLSAVADRLGVWGAPGANGVVWGDVESYESYVALLNWFVPAALVPLLGWTASIAEVVIAFGLLIGWRLHWFALAAAILLATFGLTMTFAFGIKSPLDYSVFSAASGALVLFTITAPAPPTRA